MTTEHRKDKLRTHVLQFLGDCVTDAKDSQEVREQAYALASDYAQIYGWPLSLAALVALEFSADLEPTPENPSGLIKGALEAEQHWSIDELDR